MIIIICTSAAESQSVKLWTQCEAATGGFLYLPLHTQIAYICDLPCKIILLSLDCACEEVLIFALVITIDFSRVLRMNSEFFFFFTDELLNLAVRLPRLPLMIFKLEKKMIITSSLWMS